MSNEKVITVTITGQKGDPFKISEQTTMWTIFTNLGEKKTMSQMIGEFRGTMDVLEYTNDKGNTYIKQVPKDNGGNAGGGSKGGYGGNTVGIEVGHAITNAVQICVSLGKVDAVDIEVHAKMILAIGDKMKAERAGAEAGAGSPPSGGVTKAPWDKDTTPLDMCKEAGLGDRIVKSGMPESHIEQVFEDVGKDKNRLTQEINQQLTDAGA